MMNPGIDSTLEKNETKFEKVMRLNPEVLRKSCGGGWCVGPRQKSGFELLCCYWGVRLWCCFFNQVHPQILT